MFYSGKKPPCIFKTQSAKKKHKPNRFEVCRLTTFLLVRHGATEWLEKGILHGVTDVPLNRKGKAQARKAAHALKDSGAQKLYTSSLSRCVETAREISKTTRLDPIQMDNLVELDFGWREGKPLHDHSSNGLDKFRSAIILRLDNLIRVISGETLKKFDQRVLTGWRSILSENPSGTVIVVSHSAVANRIMFHYFGNKHLDGKPYHHFHPCSITEISINPSNQAELVRLNDHSHLPKDLL